MSCNGVQYLQMKAPKARPFMRPAGGGGGATTENLDYYYLELRTPVDFDGTLGNGTRALSARVLVHVAGDRRSAHAAGPPHVPARHEPADDRQLGLNDAGAGGRTRRSPIRRAG